MLYPTSALPAPSSADLDEAIPAALRESYAEAMRALSARAPRAAVVMLRRTVEGLGIERELGAEGDMPLKAVAAAVRSGRKAR
jgi:DNA-directed RNA polymerase specialized sigma24 family protein